MDSTEKMPVITGPVRAIRAFCLECVGSSNEVKNCTTPNCILYPFRFGKNPYRAKVIISDERRAEMIANLRKNKC